MNIPIVRDTDKINHIKKQVGKLYLAIKKNEIQPDVISDKERNMNNTIEKMKLLYNI